MGLKYIINNNIITTSEQRAASEALEWGKWRGANIKNSSFVYQNISLFVNKVSQNGDMRLQSVLDLQTALRTNVT